jgi:hypothetical protein
MAEAGARKEGLGAAEGTLRRGGTGEDAGQGGEDEAVPNFPVRRDGRGEDRGDDRR